MTTVVMAERSGDELHGAIGAGQQARCAAGTGPRTSAGLGVAAGKPGIDGLAAELERFVAEI